MSNFFVEIKCNFNAHFGWFSHSIAKSGIRFDVSLIMCVCKISKPNTLNLISSTAELNTKVFKYKI